MTMLAKKYRYTLSNEHKALCPWCKEMTLSLYIDTHSGQIVDPKVGLCKHRGGGRYHYPPKQYFISRGYKDLQTKNNSKKQTYIDMQTDTENKQDKNIPTPETEAPVVIHDNGNEQKQEDDDEYYDWDTLDTPSIFRADGTRKKNALVKHLASKSSLDRNKCRGAFG